MWPTSAARPARSLPHSSRATPAYMARFSSLQMWCHEPGRRLLSVDFHRDVRLWKVISSRLFLQPISISSSRSFTIGTTNRALLSNCAHSLRRNGRVILIEYVLPGDGRFSYAPLMDLNMLVLLPDASEPLSNIASYSTPPASASTASLRQLRRCTLSRALSCRPKQENTPVQPQAAGPHASRMNLLSGSVAPKQRHPRCVRSNSDFCQDF